MEHYGRTFQSGHCEGKGAKQQPTDLLYQPLYAPNGKKNYEQLEGKGN